MDTTKSPLGPLDQLLKPNSTLDGQHLTTIYGLMRTVQSILVIPESEQIPFCVDIDMSFNRAHFTMFLGIAVVFIITAEYTITPVDAKRRSVIFTKEDNEA